MKNSKLEYTRGVSKTLTVGIVVVVVVVLVVAAFAVLFLTSSPPSSGSNISCGGQASGSASDLQISLTNGASSRASAPGYSPDSVTLVMGKNNTVTWTNNDSAAHTVTSTSAPSGASFNSGRMNSGATYSCTFTTPGTYQYYCKYHSWMIGTIVVKAASS
ncbi:MAG: cupredoxin domain-containing protein [Rhabdochlamydiaceae bacterium]